MSTTKYTSAFVVSLVILAACTSKGGSGASFETEKSINPLTPAAEEYLTDADRLPVAVAELNSAELRFITASKKDGVDASTLDAELRTIAAHATEVGLLGSSLSATMAAQEGGEGNADSFAAIARAGFALALDAQHFRTQVASDPAAIALAIADYGARMWNPSVTVEGVTGNPFLSHVSNASSIDEVTLLRGGDAEKVISQAGADREMRTWIALSVSTMTRTIDVPESRDPSIDPFDPSLVGSLKSADGQKDGERAMQVISAHLELLSPDAPSNTSWHILVDQAQAAGTKKKKVSMPTGFIPYDFYNLGKQNSDAIQQAGGKFIPILTKEMKGLATTAKTAAITNTVKAAEPELADFLKGAGVAIPTKKNTVPVINSTAPVSITIVVDEAADLSAADAQKRGYSEGEKAVSFTVSWTTANTSSFSISCNGQPVGDYTSGQASLNWPMKLGPNRITCVATGKGGAVLGSSATSVTLHETFSSSSKGLAFSAKAESLAAVSSSAHSSVVPISSAALSSKPASSAASVVSSAVTVTSSTPSSAAAAGTGWIEPYVQGFEADLLKRNFDAVAVAIVTSDLRTCLYDEVAKGKSDAAAKAACSAALKQQAASSSPANTTTDQPLPQVGITAALTETITGGPKSVFATQAVLVADHKTKIVSGTITGSASWDDSYYCYNTEDSSEIYQTVSARYTSTYTAKCRADSQMPGVSPCLSRSKVARVSSSRVNSRTKNAGT